MYTLFDDRILTSVFALLAVDNVTSGRGHSARQSGASGIGHHHLGQRLCRVGQEAVLCSGQSHLVTYF